MYTLVSFVCGLVFGIGLIVAGMSNPAKVLGFLDIAGPWDPSLALVMAGAIGVGVVAFFVARKRSLSLLGTPMRLPTVKHIDARCVGGGLVFGVGWGLVGFCPGPAFVALGSFEPKAAAFIVSMLAGTALFNGIERLCEKYPASAVRERNQQKPGAEDEVASWRRTFEAREALNESELPRAESEG